MVRFLTRRYLTEFAQLEEVTYERPVYVDDRQVTLRITDVSGKVSLSILCFNSVKFILT